MQRLLTLFSSVILAGTLFLLAACGGSNIATIGSDTTVSQATYDRWVQSALASAKKAGRPLDSPDFTACQAAIGQKNAAGKKLCQSQYDTLRKQTFTQLIQQGWVMAQAKKDGVKFDNKQVDSQVNTLRKQFPNVDGGVNDEDLQQLAKVNLAQAALQQKTLASIKPSNAQLESFYQNNPKLFAIPATRDIKMIVTNSKATASAAASALKSGQSWAKVFKKYNDEKLYNSRVPEASNVAESNFVPDLGKVIFAAPLNTVYGPKEVKQINGWAVVAVSKANSAKSAPAFAKNKAQALAAYRSEQLTKKSSASPAKLAETWQPQTDCASDYKSWYPCKGTKIGVAN